MAKSITINPTEFIMSLDNVPMKLEDRDLTVGRALALTLISGNKSPDPLRSYSLARKLDSKDPVELDTSDIKFVKECLDGFQGFTVLVIGQLLEKLA